MPQPTQQSVTQTGIIMAENTIENPMRAGMFLPASTPRCAPQIAPPIQPPTIATIGVTLSLVDETKTTKRINAADSSVNTGGISNAPKNKKPVELYRWQFARLFGRVRRQIFSAERAIGGIVFFRQFLLAVWAVHFNDPGSNNNCRQPSSASSLTRAALL